MTHLLDESALEAVEVLVSLREHKRGAAVAHGINDVIADATGADIVVDQLPVKGLELDAPVCVGRSSRLKRRRVDDDEMLEGAGRRVRLRVHSVADGSALHEDDRVVAVLPRNRG